MILYLTSQRFVFLTRQRRARSASIRKDVVCMFRFLVCTASVHRLASLNLLGFCLSARLSRCYSRCAAFLFQVGLPYLSCRAACQRVLSAPRRFAQAHGFCVVFDCLEVVVWLLLRSSSATPVPVIRG